MISQLNSSVIRNTYSSNIGEVRDISSKVNVSKQGDMSKIERIKESLESGEYKINIQALSEKIADGLL